MAHSLKAGPEAQRDEAELDARMQATAERWARRPPEAETTRLASQVLLLMAQMQSFPRPGPLEEQEPDDA